MKNRFREHIERTFNLENKRVLVAISGGVDSIVLAYLLNQLGIEIVLGHCNFQLRGEESNEDEAFVKEFGQKLNAKTFIKRFDTQKFSSENQMNTQLSARKLRYDWFEEVAMESECDFIATAHHADDNIETFIINLSRGTGLDGLLGIPQRNVKIIRPLLPFSRQEILEFAEKNRLLWREDSSNASDKYVRNKIRHNIVPVLKEIHPTFLKNFEKTQFFLAQSAQFIDFFIENIKKECFIEEKSHIKIDIEALKRNYQSDFVLYKLLYPYNFNNIRDLKQILEAETGKKLFSSTHILLKDRNFLVLEKKREKTEKIYEINKDTSEINSPISLKFQIIDNEEIDVFDEEKIFINADLLKFPILLRHKQEGDFFYPFGMNQKKKLSKFFKDEKYSIFEKEEQWLLCSGSDVVWVVGKRLDNRFRVTEKTQKVLIISCDE
ncbi:tRNA lysidine(34) synthetase TilS [Capnocytophaga stomatis]|uniref:tRNA lysidine(34) synthetase TilS n=1 Tax=Capnocytophaga stomatis TaxID=1848904 RepID=UPI001AC5262C|nr:tRNA lysidine(34) synthetase TilS [Capnocytophaga stomatis]GIM48702.1 tRNA(Ile)-lysidine synthase [Capnocytophaga stomatis]